MRAAIARRRAARARRLGRRPGVRRRARRPVRRAAALARLARRASARRSARGARPAPRRRTRASSPRCTPPTTARLEALGAVDADGLARAALDAAARGVGRAAAVPLRLRRAARPPSWTSSRRSSATRTPRSPSRSPTSPAAPRWPAARRPSSCSSRWRASTSSLEPRSEHYAPSARGALHHLERGAVRAASPARVPPNGAVRLLEAGGERAEAELVGASVLELLRDGMAPEDIAVLVRGRRRRPLRPGLRRPTASRSPASAARRSPTPASAPASSPSPAPRSRRHRERRRDVAAHAGQARTRPPTRRGRPARGRGPPPRGPHRPRRALATGGRSSAARDLVELDALAAAAEEGVAPFLNALLAEAEAIWTAPHVRRADVLDARRGGRRPRRPRAAGRGQGADPARASRPGAGRRRRRSCSTRSRAVEVRETRAGRGRHARRPARRPAGDPRAALPRGLRVRPAGGRAAAAPAARAVPGRRRARGARDRLRARAAAPRGHARRASARCSTPASRGPRRRCSSPSAARDEEGGPQQPSPFLDDVRALFTDELWDGPRPPAAGRDHLAAGRGADAARAAPLAGRRGASAPRPAPLGRARRRRRCCALLAARDRESARGLETFAGCPVKWLIEHVLRPEPGRPGPASRCGAARSPTPCSSARCAG